MVMTLNHRHGALTEAPVWEPHRRGKNWMAKIEISPSSPGGLSRDFAVKAKGDFLYILPDWMEPGAALEFGADYYSGRGRKTANRWYGYVVSVTDDAVVVSPCETAREAVEEAEKLASQPPEKEADWEGPIYDQVDEQVDLSSVPTEQLLAELKRRGVC